MKQLSRVLFMLTALVVTTTVPAQQVNPALWQQAKKATFRHNIRSARSWPAANLTYNLITG